MYRCSMSDEYGAHMCALNVNCEPQLLCSFQGPDDGVGVPIDEGSPGGL